MLNTDLQNFNHEKIDFKSEQDQDESHNCNDVSKQLERDSASMSPTFSGFRPFMQTQISAFSPVLPLRPLMHPAVTQLFQPFLPMANQLQKSGSILPFSVDNILRPSFGRRNRLPSSSSSSCSSRSTFLTSPQPPHLTSSPIDRSSPIKEEPRSPCRQDEAVDLSGSKGSPEPKNRGDNEEGVPPGMVRGPNGQLWPAWVFCTRYSDRPSSGPRSRRIKKSDQISDKSSSSNDKRPRTAFSSEQLGRLKREFEENRYLTEERRKNLSTELDLNENQIKIWFQNKRAKIKKSTGQKGELAKMLAAQGLYDHSTVPVDEDDNPIY